MAKEDFIENVRRSVGWLAPAVEVVGRQSDSDRIARDLARAAMWLTPRSVDGYDPSDFADRPEDEQVALREAVREFRNLAGGVSPDEPASDAEFARGLSLLQGIVLILRGVVLTEWSSAVEHLICDAESWSQKRNWPCRRQEKQLRETVLGDYELPQLLIQVNGASLLLDPVSRFCPGALGMVDLAVIPSYHSLMIPRDASGWHVQLQLGKDIRSVQPRPWSEETFIDAVDSLRQRA